MTAVTKTRATASNPVEIAGRLAGVAPRLAVALSAWMIRQARGVGGLDYSLIDYQGVAWAAARFNLEWWLEPQRTVAALTELWWHNLTLIANQASDVKLADRSARGDKQFKDKIWTEDPTLRLVRDAYLINSRWTLAQVRAARTLDRHDRQKLEFYTRQLLSALSPSNWPATNPCVRALTLESCGANLVEGLQRLVDDLEHGKGLVPISQHDAKAFEVGRNLAITPGKVVFRNALIELIQFTPTTNTVSRTPILVVPPWINKYYVLDLQPENSLLRWMVAEGRSVFVISWANPGTAQAETGIDDYLREGALTAIEVVREIAAAAELDLVGFCIGGILTRRRNGWQRPGGTKAHGGRIGRNGLQHSETSR